MLESIYNRTSKKFNVSEVSVGDLVLVKLEPFTEYQLKKDPSLREMEEPDVYFVAYVVKRLSRSIRVCSAGLNDDDPFNSSPYVDLPQNQKVVWLTTVTRPVQYWED